MQNRILSLSLVISAVLIIPSLAVAETVENVMPVGTVTTSVDENDARQVEAEQDTDELLATQQDNIGSEGESDTALVQADADMMEEIETEQPLQQMSKQKNDKLNNQPKVADKAPSSAQDNTKAPIVLQESRRFVVR